MMFYLKIQIRMRTLELENYGVGELNLAEKKEIDGGLWFAPAIPYLIKAGEAIALWWATDAANNPNAHTGAMQQGFEDGKKAAGQISI
jgi:hypothetical protein